MRLLKFSSVQCKAKPCRAVQPLSKTNVRQKRHWGRKSQICIIIRCQQPLLSSVWAISRSPSQLWVIQNDRSTYLHMAITAWLYTSPLSRSLIYISMCLPRVNFMKKWQGHCSPLNKKYIFAYYELTIKWIVTTEINNNNNNKYSELGKKILL